jgi:hypothetical protein
VLPPTCGDLEGGGVVPAGAHYVCDIARRSDAAPVRELRCRLSESQPVLRLRGDGYVFAELAAGTLRLVVNSDEKLRYRSGERSQITVDQGANTPRLWARGRKSDTEVTIECRFVGA